MKITKHLVTRAMLPLLAITLAGTSAQAKGPKVHTSRHARASIYLEFRHEAAATDWYMPPRSPGWHDETGS